MIRSVKSIFACVVLTVATLTGGFVAAAAAHAGLELGGEAIIIDDVEVGSVIYTAVCGVSRPSLPVTVIATFLTPTVPPEARPTITTTSALRRRPCHRYFGDRTGTSREHGY